jgi:tRNA 5-methylaminomethyl-2-thiouridine biosynthesis bifunctional protein
VKTSPIEPAQVEFPADDAPRAPRFDDRYHPREGAAQQAQQVFLAGNGLPERWRGRPRFTVMETGFGLGGNFLATWAAWRADPGRCTRLHFVSLEQYPLAPADLARVLAASPWPEQARELLAAWPPLTPNLHRLDFDQGRVQLLLGFGDAATLARELVARVDAFFLDGFAPAHNPAMWSERLFAALARLAAPGARAATWSAARAVRDGLAGAGFDVLPTPGPGAKRDITLARYAPRHLPAPARRWPDKAPEHAVIVGAGLAGAATARALARAGIACTVLDAESEPAQHASGHPGGLYHGTVGAHDGPHARLHRAASAYAARWARDAGSPPQGLLRLGDDLAAMRALAAVQALPRDYVRVVDAAEASALAGVPLARPAWFYPRGGAADPGALVRHALATAGVVWRGGIRVAALLPAADGWRLLDDAGRTIAEAPIVVLCNAHDALRLAGLPVEWARRTRGQLTRLAPADLLAAPPRLPIASGGYALPMSDGGLLVGATQHVDDDDAQLRAGDHALNLASAQRLLGRPVARAQAMPTGRVAWRMVTRDRLPLVGAAPDLCAPAPARPAPRFVVRRPGLYLHCALGSRGLTTAALCGELLAAQIAGTPWPLEADLADAIDAARFVVRGDRARTAAR